ncbi:MAG: peptide deformylase [Gammaproteobacteria bacterium]|nr:peptide deformylase [Gammaproteobacteria bacterium]
MSVKEVLKMGHPILGEKSRAVTEFGSPALASLIEDMLDTMHALNGAGLAAPQIGVSLRVVIFAVESNPRYPHVEPIPQTILINPEIIPLSDAQESGWEGCLSIPGMRGWVPRYAHVRYSGYTQTGEFFEREVRGFHARVVQHEVDHLDGVLYPLRMPDLTRFGFEQELFPATAVMPE